MLIIVNADDLGTSEKVNNRIFELMETGSVTSASIISNGPAFDHAIQNIHKYPWCSFGVHLNLTVFQPLTKSACSDRMLSSDGSFRNKLQFDNYYGKTVNAVLYELSAQVQKVIDAGVKVSHFDSHQHIHTLPQLFGIIKRLQQKFGIYRVRNTINLVPPDHNFPLVKRLKKNAYSFALRNILPTKTTDGFCSFTTFHKILENGTIPSLNSLELMVHPGTTYEPYNDEVHLLQSNTWLSFLSHGVKFSSYNSL